MRIPVYDEAQVAPDALPTVRDTVRQPDNLGALAQGTAQLAQGVEQLDRGLQISQEKADVAAATGAIAQFQNGVLDLEHGTEDGKTPGLFQLQGEDAVQSSVPTLQAIDKLQRQIASGLKSDAQRQMFLAHTEEQKIAHRRAIEEFTGNQVRVVQKQKASALADTAVNTAAANYGDNLVVGLAAQSARDALAASMYGEPPDVVKAAQDELSQKIAVARIGTAIAKSDATGAKSLLDQYRGSLGPVAPQLARQVEALGDAQASDVQAQGILQSATVKGYPWLDEASALEKVQLLPPGKLKDETQARVEHQLLLNRQMKEQAGRDKLNELQALYAQSGNPNDTRMAPIRAWMMDPHNGAAGLLEQFDRGVRVEQRASRESDAAVRRAQQQADQDAFYDYMARPLEDRAKLDVEKEYLGDVSKLGRDRIRAQQQKDAVTVRQGGVEGEAEFARDIRNEARRASLDNGKDLSKQPDLQKFLGYMGAWRQQYVLDHGKPPSRTDVRAQLSDALTKVTQKGFLWDSNVFRFQADNGDKLPRAPDDAQMSPLAKGETELPAATPATAVPAPAPKPAAAVTVVERRKTKDGRTLEKLSDGSIRVANGE